VITRERRAEAIMYVILVDVFVVVVVVMLLKKEKIGF
jgi:predicted nucleic acid-binding Zn ribbon protein